MILLDSHLNIFLQSLGAWLLPVMHFFSFIGSDIFYLLLVSTVYWCFDQRWGIRLALAYLFASTLNSIFKLVFQLPRPYWVDPRINAYAYESSFGFPSGHAQMSIAVWGILGNFQKKIWTRYTAIFIILMIGISRLYLGVHFLADVLSGWILGSLILLLFFLFEDQVLDRFAGKKTWIQFILAVTPVVIILGTGILMHNELSGFKPPFNWITFGNKDGHVINPVSIKDLVYRSGIWLGLAAGFFWLKSRETLQGRFTIDGTINQKIWRFLVGLAGLIMIWSTFGLAFPKGETAFDLFLQLFRHACMGFWISGLAPVVFMHTGLVKSVNIRKRKSS